jgi:transcriptional regulator with XRE-family HTH domain
VPAKAIKTRRKKASSKSEEPVLHHDGLAIGIRLKHARLNRRVSLRDLADQVGCTEGFLSKVENDKVRPSLTMLHNLVKALDFNIAKLFSAPEVAADISVLKAGKRVTLQTEKSQVGEGITLESLLPIPLTALLEVNIHHVEPQASTDGLIDHKGEEMGYVLEGTLELVVNGQIVQVQQGDSFFFQSHLPHGYRNPGKSTARILWVNTPQSF